MTLVRHSHREGLPRQPHSSERVLRRLQHLQREQPADADDHIRQRLVVAGRDHAASDRPGGRQAGLVTMKVSSSRAARPARRVSRICEEPRVRHRGGVVDCARRRRQHRHLQRGQRAAAAPASISGRRSTHHPLEPLARVGDRRGLVFHRTVLRHQDRQRELRAGRDCDRRQRQPHR